MLNKRTKEGQRVMNNTYNVIRLFQPIHQKKVAQYMNMSERNVRKVISKLREKKIPIGFGNHGYFIAKDMDEIRHTLNILKCKNKSTVDMMFNLEEGVKKYEVCD